MKSKTLTVAITIITLTLTSLTHAGLDTVDIRYTGYAASGMANVWGGGLNGEYARVGVYNLEKTAGTGEGNIWENGTIYTFCIELSENNPLPTETYDVVQPQYAQKPGTYPGLIIGPAKAEYIKEAWGRFFDPAWTGTGTFTELQNSDAEAFGAALWEIIYEELPETPALWDVTVDGTDGPGGFRATDLNSNTANSMLHALDGTGPKADLRAFVFCGKQDYLAQVPEPATVVLLLVGAVTLLRKRKK